MPTVSILTTVYNREKYIADCIESVIASTFQDWEMIIVDDQSKDGSVEIARKYEKEDSRIKVYENEQNLGDYPNRNKAASYAVGKYIKYIDADDTIYPHGLEVMVKAMEKFPNAILGSQGTKREDRLPYPFILEEEELFTSSLLIHNYFTSGPTGTIIRRDTFNRLGGFSGKRFIGDTEMWMKLALEGPVVIFQPSLIWWRQHPDQESNQEVKYEVDLLYARNRLFWETITNDKLPVNGMNKRKAVIKHQRSLLRLLISKLLKHGQPLIVWHIFKLLVTSPSKKKYSF